MASAAPSRAAAGVLFAALSALLVVGCLGPRPAWEEPTPPMREGPVVAEGALTRTELANGLHVIILEDHRLPRVVFGIDVRRGRASVASSEAGLAALTVELMKRGAGGRDALELAEAVDEIGASLSVNAGWDEMAVATAGLSRDRSRLLEILSDIVLRPHFEEEEADRARSEALASLQRSRDDPATLQGWYMSKTLYDGHRYGVPRGGTMETVAKLDAAAARAFHGRVFVPNNAVFSATGDVDPDELLAQIRELFGDWKVATPPDPGPAPPDRTPRSRRVVIVDRPDLAQSHIAVAHEGLARTNPDRIAAALMNGIIGGSGFSSRLTSVLRADEGLTYGVHSGFSLRRMPGPWLVMTSTRVAETRRVIDLVLAELERARTNPPSAEELAEAQMLTAGGFALGLETSDAVMASLVDLDIHGLPDDSLDTYRGRVRAVTTADTARVALELLHPERAAIIVVGPAQVLQSQLEGLGPVEVVTP